MQDACVKLEDAHSKINGLLNNKHKTAVKRYHSDIEHRLEEL